MRPRELLERARRMRAGKEAAAVDLSAVKARLLSGIDPDARAGPLRKYTPAEADAILAGLPSDAHRRILATSLRIDYTAPDGKVVGSEYPLLRINPADPIDE